MASIAGPSKRRLQIVVKEAACPGLIEKLGQLPEGCENVFIRAVLTEWFLSNSDDAESANRLVEKYRTIEFRNEKKITLVAYGDVVLPNPIKILPIDRGIEKSLPVERSNVNVHSQNVAGTSQMAPAVIPISSGLTERPRAPMPSPAAAFDVDFDPDQF